METKQEYNGYKLITHKLGKGGYRTYIFNGGVIAIHSSYAKLKKHSISFAKSHIDNDIRG